MMTNLFSTFDPQSLIHLSLNWLITPLITMMFPNKMWIKNNQNLMMTMNLQFTIEKETKSLILNNLNKGTLITITTLMLMIMVHNLMGLFPYLFTSPSHISMTLPMALSIWMSIMMYGWTKKTNSMFSHLVPPSSPPILIPFMIMIETVSNCIRPITLSVRLMTNLTAGHLIMSLSENTMALMPMISLPMMVMMMIQMMLFTLETAVAIIQAYVFSILVILYIKEIN
uniref:ATP synthase subunit a n=1 Tax=Aposthonia borneensis TaxID=1208762 RepID=A0A343CXL5_9NEOP|nr:ATP synthase F0 subunit 6 [Aposthonia borneensis]